MPIGLNHLTGTPRPLTGKQRLVSPSPSDWELVLASREDPQAFVGIFERYFDEIHGYLRGRVGRSSGAELASETFAQAFAGRGRFDPRRGEVRAWLYAIAVNLLRHHYRRERRQLRAYARTGVEPVAAGDEALAPLDADVAGLLAELSANEREILLMYRLGRAQLCRDRGGARRPSRHRALAAQP